MQFLLDTHTFIWFINGNNSLSNTAVNNIKNINYKCYISITSIWEIAIKANLNKLDLKYGFDKIPDLLINNEIEILPITFEHIQMLNKLEFHHKDPFDRVIIAQAITEKFTVITVDEWR
ncbi:MAG: type II toxin-antitoxin system VapC family toxin [Sphingobacteriaceae bacterium]|nr:MAG: type II toxin-antitoxin system VapC family toxin [Sphingobacteriaceae bacterium]